MSARDWNFVARPGTPAIIIIIIIDGGPECPPRISLNWSIR
jgi:hypothetical protein